MNGKVLVTGASGLVGASLVRALLTQGREVRAMVHRERRAFEGLDVELAPADVRDADAVGQAVDGVDVVYHLAATISVADNAAPAVEAVNVMGTRNVVAACLRSGVRRLVHFSSIEALRQEPLDQPVDETRVLADVDPDATRAASAYSHSKVLAEREVLAGIAEGLDAVILNPTAMLGPYDYKPSFMGQGLVQMASGRFPALVPGGFDWVDVRDVVAGALRAEEVAPPGARYVLSGHWHTVREVAELAAAEEGRSAPLITVPLWLASVAAPLLMLVARRTGTPPIYTRATLRMLTGNRQVSHAKATRELGYTPRPLAESVDDAVAWFEANGYLRRRAR